MQEADHLITCRRKHKHAYRVHSSHFSSSQLSFRRATLFQTSIFSKGRLYISSMRLTQQNAPTVECMRPWVALEVAEHQIITLAIPWRLSTARDY